MKFFKNKNNLLIVSIVILTLFFFVYAVTITWDSAHYMSYVNIFERVSPVSSWDIVRGPVFPLIIYFSNLFFGKTVQGLLINSYIYYLIMLLFVYKTIREVAGKKEKIIILFFLLIIFNPIIYGYYHTLLTEFVAMTLAVLSCYLSYLWLNNSFFKDSRKSIMLTFIFGFLTVFGWFLKQPYVSTTFFPLAVAFLISLFRRISFKEKVMKFISVFICVIFLVVSIGLWNSIMNHFNVDSGSDRNPTSTLGNNLINAVNCLNVNANTIYDVEDILNDNYLSLKEKNKIISLLNENDNSFVIIDVLDSNKRVVDKVFVDVDVKNLSTFGALKILFKEMFSHPILILQSYLDNYLSIVDIYGINTEDSVNYEIIKKIDIRYASEISSIGMKPYSYTSNIFYITDDAYERVKNYEQFNEAPKLLNYFMIVMGKASILLFKFVFLIMPFALIISIVKRIKTKNKKLDLVIILLGFSFLHLILHTVTAAVIDRYAMPALIPSIIGIGLLIYLFFRKEV